MHQEVKLELNSDVVVASLCNMGGESYRVDTENQCKLFEVICFLRE